MLGLSLHFWEIIFFWATVIAAVAGGIGVASAFFSAIIGYRLSEIVQAQANQRIAEADLKAAAANEAAEKAHERSASLERDAAEARAEQERIKGQLAWRRISPQQHDAMVTVLRDRPSDVVVGHASNDPEAAVYAEDIARTMQASGWKVNRSGFIGPQPTFGLQLMSRQAVQPDPEAERISAAFSAAGIPLAEGVPAPFLTVNVWNKPPPF